MLDKHHISYKICCAAFVLAVFSVCAQIVCAERLPVKNYTVADGLAHNWIRHIFQDAKGFLWLATGEGLSRFDGYGFTNYTRTDGLPHDFVNDVVADREGHLWAATNGGGVARLIDEPEAENQPAKREKFVSFAITAGGENNLTNWVNRILFDADNRLWCVTDAGLFRAKNLEVADNDFELVAAGMQPLFGNAAFADTHGRLWFSLKQRVLQIAGGQTTAFEFEQDVSQIIETKSGRILAENVTGIYEFLENEKSWREIRIEREKTQFFQIMLETADGDLWIGTGDGLIRLSGGRQTVYRTENGLIGMNISDLAIDRENNLWIGTLSGLSKLTNTNVVSYSSVDASRVTADRAGNIYAQIGCAPGRLAQIGEQTINFIPNSDKNGDCRKNKFFQDETGRFWFDTPHGLAISEQPALNFAGGRILTLPDGKPINYQAIAEDAATGKIWLTSGNNLYVADTPPKDDLPKFALVAQNVPAEFILPDSAGNVWLAERTHLWRLGRNGAIEEIKQIENLAAIQPRSLFQDASGRVWIGTRSDGVIFTDAPEAANPHFQHLTVADGLASNTVWTIAEDNQKAIYFGTGRGVDRFDPATGKMRHLTVDDGVIGSIINHLFKSPNGEIWAAANEGISRINPARLGENLQPSPVFITRVLVAGEELPLAETGVSAIAAPAFSATQNNIAIRFVGLSFQNEHALRYEYRLEGVDTFWTQAGEQREVNYANLAAGNYRFAVRATNAADVKSVNPAVFEFQILRPVWQRWWFVASALILISLFGYGVYRYRLNKLLEIERTRTRIASDLHDDIGSNLAKISLLSEIVNLQLVEQNTESRRLLNSIAEISRESVGSMSDIVWAINPKRDSVLELVRRMRLHVEELFLDKNVRVRFNAPDDGAATKLSMNLRRELFLIFKEAVSNAARHADCQNIEIDFRLESGKIFLQIADDGKGFDISQKTDGNGLENIRNRAARNGGNCAVESEIGNGTILKIRFPQN